MQSVLKYIIFTFVIFINPLLTSAQSGDIAGQNDPKFNSAVYEWLDGKDNIAIPMFVELAQTDNRAAQIFLGRLIGAAGHTIFHFLDTLPKDQYRSFIRKKDESRFGKSWMRAAGADTELARGFSGYGNMETILPALRILLQNNEFSAAHDGIAILLNQDIDKILLLASEGLLDHRYQAYIKHAYSISRSRITSNGLKKSHPQSIQEFSDLADLSFSNSDKIFTLWTRPSKTRFPIDAPYPDIILRDKALFNLLKFFVDYDNRMEPVRLLCVRICPETPSTCGIALRAHYFTYSSFYARTHSPVESLISTEMYRNSTRFPDDMRRLLLYSKRKPERVRQIDGCFVDFLLK